tara:strand:- start:124 stop:1005 length:882 start_codon:yes stop_codon:yes gene_type:complete
MLAEAIHSFADTANQLLIYVGIRVSKKGPTRDFPTGYGQARYLWNLISASGIFFVGFGVTTYHGVSALISPHDEGGISYGLGIGILIFALIVEGYALLVALKEVNNQRGSMSLSEFIRNSDDPTSMGVLLEDSIAVLGVIFALLGMALSSVFHTHIPDAIASIFIGVLLGFLAFIMAFTNGRLLINRSASASDENEIKLFVESMPVVDKITVFRTEVLGQDQMKLTMEIDFNSEAIHKVLLEEIGDPDENNYTVLAKEAMKHTISLVGSEINKMEKQIQDRFSDIKYIDLEIN